MHVLFCRVDHLMYCRKCCAFCRDISCELYVDHYCRDLPELHCIRSTAVPAIAKGLYWQYRNKYSIFIRQ